MLTYDPNVDTLSSPIPEQTEMTVDEELARAALDRDKRAETKTVPTGLLRNYQPEKNVDESQMADFSTPIEEVMAGPGQMLQNEMMGSPYAQPQRAPSASRKRAADEDEPRSSSKNPLGLTDEQFQALVAGAAAVVAFSKPVQTRLRTMVPKFVGESGDVSLTGLIVSALVAAIIFYFAKKFIVDKA
jgi:Family of unknown function (DUF5792)